MDGIETLIDSLSEGVELLQRSLQCSICLEMLNDPVFTRCCHNFCRHCIMRVIETHRMAHCPLCNKSINRRGITENQKIGLLVEKVQKVIEGIGKDTGFDITEHVKLPSSTKEAFVASPKFVKAKDETNVKQINSPQVFVKPTVRTSKEQWLKRYEKQYPAKQNIDDDVDLLSISQAETNIPNYIPKDRKLQAAKNKVDKIKVPTAVKVEEWLQKKENDFEEETFSPLSPESQKEPRSLTVTADVHEGLEDDPDLLSVSQQQYYIAPRKTIIDVMKGSSDGLTNSYSIQKSSDKIFPTTDNDVNKEKNEEIVKMPEKNSVDDPYEFVSSEKTYKETKTKNKRKINKMSKKTNPGIVQKYETYLKKNYEDKKNKKNECLENKVEKVVELQSQPYSESTFICPIEVNNTFDNLVFDARGSEKKKEKDLVADKLDPPKQRNLVSKEVDDGDDECLFRTPLQSAIIFRNRDDESSTESMSDVDFSSGSDEEWGNTNKVAPETIKVNNKRLRKASCDTRPSKKVSTEKELKLETLPASSAANMKLSTKRKETDSKMPDAGQINTDNTGTRKVLTFVKKTPLSPSKKINCKMENKTISAPDDSKEKLWKYVTEKKAIDLSKEKFNVNKENMTEPSVETTALQNISNINTVVSRSPGWSRITQTKKDFEKFKKPMLKALDVSGGEACITKKHSSNDAGKEKNLNSTLISPIPTIDDTESNVSVTSTYPVVAFNSPDAVRRAQMMSKIVKDFEKEIGPSTSILSEGESVILDETIIGTNTLGVVALQKSTSFTSAFSAIKEESPTTNKRKQQITNIISSLDIDSVARSQNEIVPSKVTEVTQEGHAKTILDVIDSSKKNLTEECSSSMVEAEATVPTEIHEKDVKLPENAAVASNETSEEQVQMCNVRSTAVVLIPESETNTEELAKKANSETCVDSIDDAAKSVTGPDKQISQDFEEEQKQMELFATDVEKESVRTMDSSCNKDSSVSHSNYSVKNASKFVETAEKKMHDVSNLVHETRCDATALHVPFIKRGALRYFMKYVNVRFIHLGSLVPKNTKSNEQNSQESTSSATLSLQFIKPAEPWKPETKCIGIQTSPKVGECLSAYGILRGTDAKAMTTPTTNPNFVQFITPVWTADSENFVPDSMGDNCIFQSAIPLPQRSALWDIPPAFDKSSQAGNHFMSQMYEIAEPLSFAQKPNKEKSNSLTSEEDDTTATFKKPQNIDDLGLPVSQLSTATTVKISRPKMIEPIEKTPALPPDSMESDHSVSLLKASQLSESSGNANVERTDLSNQVHSQDRPSQNDENKKSEYEKELSPDAYEDKSRNSSCRSDTVPPSRRSSRASRQLKFSPYSIPKLTDPNISMEEEEQSKNSSRRSIKKIQNNNSPSSSECKSILSVEQDSSNKHRNERKSYKRIRKPSTSSDSELSGSEKKSSSEHEKTRKSQSSIKKIKSNEDMAEDFDTGEVIDLLTQSGNTSDDSIIPGTFEKGNFEEWLNKDVPNSEELMERMMANIDTDLAETRKRRALEQENKSLDESKAEMPSSPMLFTPQPTAEREGDSEEASNKLTCELVRSQSVERKEVSKSNITDETDTENLCTQKAQAGISVLEAQIKKCQEALKKVEVEGKEAQISVCVESDESEEDFVRPTPQKDEVTNKIRSNRSREPANQGKESKENSMDKQIVPLGSHNTTSVGPIRKSLEADDRKKEIPKLNSMESPSTEPTSPKQFVLRLPTAAESMQETKTPEQVTVSSTHRETPSARAQPPSKLCFACSGLPMELIDRVKALARLLGAEFSNKFEPYTTHLVVRAADSKMADKTYKYLSAVARRKWVVSIAWVNACLQARKLLSEDEYEMLDSSGENGPRRSRTSSRPLFKNFEFCCIEPFADLTRDQLEDILTVCGGTTVRFPEKFTFKQHSIILIQMDIEREEECKELWKTYGILPIGHEWIFECIGRFRIMPIWSFLMFDVNEDNVRALGYPEDALASDEENEIELEVGSKPG